MTRAYFAIFVGFALLVGLAVYTALPEREAQATQLLRNSGLSDISLTGYTVFGCSEDDVFRLRFRAKSPDSTPVEGVVCSGFLKGSTIRYF